MKKIISMFLIFNSLLFSAVPSEIESFTIIGKLVDPIMIDVGDVDFGMLLLNEPTPVIQSVFANIETSNLAKTLTMESSKSPSFILRNETSGNIEHHFTIAYSTEVFGGIDPLIGYADLIIEFPNTDSIFNFDETGYFFPLNGLYQENLNIFLDTNFIVEGMSFNFDELLTITVVYLE